jgi:dCTP deaminase
MSIVNGDVLLIASPILDMIPTKQRLNNVSHGLAEVGYDIRIKQTVEFCPNTDINGYLKPGLIFVDGEVSRGNFCLASAIEEFDMPVDLVGIVHDKSTWARCGLSVFNTVIEPGWKGFLTLELVYHGQTKLVIPAGTGIAQVIFHRLDEPASYSGAYQNQKDEPVGSIIRTHLG